MKRLRLLSFSLIGALLYISIGAETTLSHPEHGHRTGQQSENNYDYGIEETYLAVFTNGRSLQTQIVTVSAYQDGRRVITSKNNRGNLAQVVFDQLASNGNGGSQWRLDQGYGLTRLYGNVSRRTRISERSLRRLLAQHYGENFSRLSLYELVGKVNHNLSTGGLRID